MKTFHRNVSKFKVQQAGHRAERSCSLRPRKAVAFLTHLLRVPRSMGTGISLSADSDSGGSSPPENLPPAALSWSSLFGATVLKSFCPCTMLLVLVGTGCAVSADFTAIKPHVTARLCWILPFLRDRIEGLTCEKAGAIVDLYNKLWYNIYNHPEHRRKSARGNFGMQMRFRRSL